MLEDITERKQTEETLSQLERKLLFHLQQTPLAVIEWDLNFRVIGWNPAAEKIFGFSRREALGRHATQLILPDYLHEEIGQLWRKLVTSKSSITNTNANLRGNGKTIMCEWHSTPLINENGQVESVLSIAQDITDRKRTEEELWQFATRLEQSNRELQDFAFVASHDLQEPLRKIQAFGDRLKTKYADTLPEEGQDYISRMQVASKRMQTLINDLLMLSRVTTNAHPFSPVNLNQVVQEVLSDLEIRIHQGGAAIEVSELPVIEADPLQMRQLLQNLISNALKFHQPDTTPIIRVQAQLFPYAPADFPVAPSHSSAYSTSGAPSLPPLCQLRVIDNGIGFDEKHLSRIFTVFNRLHGRNEYEGTGIGLAICRKIVERHRGHITARSTPGQGAIFIVTLPTIQSTSSLA